MSERAERPLNVGWTDVFEAHAGFAYYAPLSARLFARLQPGRFDRLVAENELLPLGHAVTAHAQRIISTPERQALARTLRRSIREAHGRTANNALTARVRLHEANVRAAEALIDALALRLDSPHPITPHGMAALRLLLSDGAGPFYQFGRGDLSERLGAVLAKL
ncbi:MULTISPECIES: hypothetical protein [unclassified Mycobacterium]|uniref:hypothetical protein n=1 Tax=unclassified Mycobacterium TaxID=2642494 RepID=UPI0029C7FDA5|nr:MULTISPECIES: hypothetical protein [unclassified Mycobacterium]